MQDLLSILSQGEVWILLAAGSAIGYVFGMLPGMSGLIALALFAPLGIFMDQDTAFFFFAAILGAAVFAGSIPAILFRIPGTPFSIVTTFDGYPMTQRGYGLMALTISAVGSALGALISLVLLILAIPLAQEIVLFVGPAEQFWLISAALLLVPVLIGKNLLKGFMSGLLGLTCAFVGRSVVTGEFRYNFGSDYLAGGLGTIAFLAIGVMAVATILEMATKPKTVPKLSGTSFDFRQILQGIGFVMRKPLTVLRGAGIGTLVGATPGTGGVTASFISYGVERGASKNPQDFGKGKREGVLAPEAANNATAGGGLMPTLFLGIPGGLEWAVFLGILVGMGVTPGASIYETSPNAVIGIIGGIAISNILASTVGLPLALLLIRLILVRPFYLVTVLFVSSMLGTYMMNSNIWDMGIAIIGGVLGYILMNKGYELLPFALAFVLAPIWEQNFYVTLQSGLNTPVRFFESPLSWALIIVCVLVIVFGKRIRRRLLGNQEKLIQEERKVSLHDER